MILSPLHSIDRRIGLSYHTLDDLRYGLESLPETA